MHERASTKHSLKELAKKTGGELSLKESASFALQARCLAQLKHATQRHPRQ